MGKSSNQKGNSIAMFDYRRIGFYWSCVWKTSTTHHWNGNIFFGLILSTSGRLQTEQL